MSPVVTAIGVDVIDKDPYTDSKHRRKRIIKEHTVKTKQLAGKQRLRTGPTKS